MHTDKPSSLASAVTDTSVTHMPSAEQTVALVLVISAVVLISLGRLP
jgi:hypothetical protein